MEEITATQQRPRTAGGVSAGDEASFHRYKYTGRGRRHIIGRYNYEKFGRVVGVDLIPSPVLLENIATSEAVSVKFRDKKTLSKQAVLWDFDRITKVMNSGGSRSEEKRHASKKKLELLGPNKRNSDRDWLIQAK